MPLQREQGEEDNDDDQNGKDDRTHDLELVIELCTDVVVMSGGRAGDDGTPASVPANAPLLDAHCLEAPGLLRLF